MFIKSGPEFEHFVAEVFEENGHCAEVTQASGDFGVDLILNGEIAVQVKFYGATVGPTAVQEVVAGMAFYNCSEAWVVTNSTFTPAAELLAKANNVRLIAGDELQWIAENPDRSANHRERYDAAVAAAKAEAFDARIQADIDYGLARLAARKAQDADRARARDEYVEQQISEGLFRLYGSNRESQNRGTDKSAQGGYRQIFDWRARGGGADDTRKTRD
jgi:hypothetical protein